MTETDRRSPIGLTEPTADVAAEDTAYCRAAQTWLHRPGTPLNPVSGLALWNLQWSLVATRTNLSCPGNTWWIPKPSGDD